MYQRVLLAMLLTLLASPVFSQTGFVCDIADAGRFHPKVLRVIVPEGSQVAYFTQGTGSSLGGNVFEASLGENSKQRTVFSWQRSARVSSGGNARLRYVATYQRAKKQVTVQVTAGALGSQGTSTGSCRYLTQREYKTLAAAFSDPLQDPGLWQLWKPGQDRRFNCKVAPPASKKRGWWPREILITQDVPSGRFQVRSILTEGGKVLLSKGSTGRLDKDASYAKFEWSMELTEDIRQTLKRSRRHKTVQFSSVISSSGTETLLYGRARTNQKRDSVNGSITCRAG